MRVFINYRRSDSAAYAGRLFDNLTNALGKDSVFRDIDSIDIGTNFEGVIKHSLSNADAVIVIIGPTWVRTPDDSGRPRIEDEHDYVRMEIEGALEHDVQVVPVLVGGAAMPTAAELPPALAPMTLQNALALTDQHWSNDVNTLVGALTRVHGRARPRRRRTLLVTGIVLGFVLVGLAIAAAAGAFSSSKSAFAGVVPRDAYACTVDPAPPKGVGIKRTESCASSVLRGGSIDVVLFDDLAVGLEATNETQKFDASTASKGCPPKGASAHGLETLATPPGAVLECITSPVDAPVYIYTVPSKNAVVTVRGGPSATTENMDAWFQELAR